MQRLSNIFNLDALRPLRFLLVGGIATATHLLVAAVVLTVYPALSAYATNGIAFLVAFMVSFYGHRHITFKTQGSKRRFLLVAIGGFLMNNAILTLCLNLAINDLAAVAIATICVPILTYLASLFWAFKTDET
ncbi:GtrA family protein [Chromohalobacter japonicus]|uniref:GtrA family protein n=1 Tax=Chromohalobacter japonicus TaxID=223900 RepID=UPI0006940A51